MEGEQEAVTFVLKIDENGRHIYTLQPTGERYELDEATREMIEIQEPMSMVPNKRIKLERPDIEDVFEVGGPEITEFEEEVAEEVGQAVMAAEAAAAAAEIHQEPADVTPLKHKKAKKNIETLDTMITQYVDIQAPLLNLKTILEKRFSTKLDGYEFWLQDKQLLESHRTLVDQCVQGEGLVQVNLRIKKVGDSKRINIEDVLKPAEEYPELLEETMMLEEEEEEEILPGAMSSEEQKRDIMRWIVDSQFKRDAERLKIPQDPCEWTVPHVRHWLQWAVRQFNLVGLKLSDWQMTGDELCQLSLIDFKAKVKRDPHDVFWTHLELLRKCKFVAVVQTKETTKSPGTALPVMVRPRGRSPKGASKLSRVIGMPISAEYPTSGAFSAQVGNRTGNNGQVQLWQFLLELLTDKEHRHIIQWLGNEGEFKLINPEIVAQLWGQRKNKPTMNYEKLSRALRYYYDGDMISKVHGKRFVYKYVCDLKQLIGYSPNELNRLCAEAAISSNILMPMDELNYEEC